MATTNNRRAVKKETAISEDSSLVIQDPIAPAKEPETLDAAVLWTGRTFPPAGHGCASTSAPPPSCWNRPVP